MKKLFTTLVAVAALLFGSTAFAPLAAAHTSEESEQPSLTCQPLVDAMDESHEATATALDHARTVIVDLRRANADLGYVVSVRDRELAAARATVARRDARIARLEATVQRLRDRLNAAR